MKNNNRPISPHLSIYKPQILELIGFIKPVNIHVVDLNLSIQFSWLARPFIIKSQVIK